MIPTCEPVSTTHPWCFSRSAVLLQQERDYIYSHFSFTSEGDGGYSAASQSGWGGSFAQGALRSDIHQLRGQRLETSGQN